MDLTKYNISIIENDSTLPHILKSFILNYNINVQSYWFNFSCDLHNNYENVLSSLKYTDETVLILTNPSFVGDNNSFEQYLFLLYKLIDKNKLNFLIINDELMDIINEFVSEGNDKKQEHNRNFINEILNYHNIYHYFENKFKKIKNI